LAVASLDAVGDAAVMLSSFVDEALLAPGDRGSERWLARRVLDDAHFGFASDETPSSSAWLFT
jgi:hypothetical protein